MRAQDLLINMHNKLFRDYSSLRLIIASVYKKNKYFSPPISKDEFEKKLSELSADELSTLNMRLNTDTKLKSPSVFFWIFTLFFAGLGVPNFILGDKIGGILRIILNVFLYLALVILFVGTLGAYVYALVEILRSLVCFVIYICDLHANGILLRNYNLHKVLKLIDEIRGKR